MNVLNEQINEAYLEKAKPYMLRNDGELLDCGDLHPYFKYEYDENPELALNHLMNRDSDFIEWFYMNTHYNTTKDKIKSLLFSLLNVDDFKLQAQSLIDALNLQSTDMIVKDMKQIVDIFLDLNNDTNQEFCRVRTSHLKYGGTSNEVYFRISSIHFNWYDIIWKIVLDNKNFIENITITKDTQVFGGKYQPYKHGDKVIEHMAVNDFLTLSGNPVIEKFKSSLSIISDAFNKLYEGKSFGEIYFSSHPRYANGFYTRDVKDSLEWDMNNILSYRPSLNESLLQEARRQDLINKSKNADNYSPKNQAKGKNRYERRRYSSISTSVSEYNNINMDAFFKGDILEFGVKVHGETDDYVVTITFEGILKELQREVKANNNVLNFKCVLRALMMSFNNQDVYVSCQCPDFTYRFSYQATKNQYNSGTPETRPAKITNPNDTKGAGCKHILLVLSNMDWMMKIASVINNYIRYSRDYLQRNYADYIFPVVYGVPYKKAVQMSIFDKEDEFGDAILPTDKKTIDDVIASSKVGRDEKGKFNKENPFKFQSKQDKENELIDFSKDDDNQMTIDFEEEETK